MRTSTTTHNSPMLRNERGQFLTSQELMVKLGLPASGHLPIGGFGPTEIEGCTFLCRPAQMGIGRKGRAHRLLFECKCKRFIPFGRANQHKCKETLRGN